MYVGTYVSQFCHYHHHHKRESKVKRGRGVNREKIPTPNPPLLLLKLITENVVLISGQVIESHRLWPIQAGLHQGPANKPKLTEWPTSQEHMLSSGRPQREGGWNLGFRCLGPLPGFHQATCPTL